MSISLKAILKSFSNFALIFFFIAELSATSTSHFDLAAFFASFSIAPIIGTKLSCPNFTASNISFSDNPDASDSTINTASFVPATTKSKLEFSKSFGDGLRM